MKKTQYRVKVIDWTKLKNIISPAEYFKACNNAPVKYCNGFREVCSLCGGRPYRQRNGWSAIRGNIEYVIEKI